MYDNRIRKILSFISVVMLIVALLVVAVALVSTTASATYHRCSPLANSTLTPINMSLYNQTQSDLTGDGDYSLFNLDNLIGDSAAPFVQTYGPLFWGILFGAFALAYFIRHETAIIPILLLFTGGLPIILWSLPYDLQKAVGVIVILVIAGILYALRKKRY